MECAIDALKKMNFCVQELMTLLGPKDFELLVDLVFSTSGWRRQGAVGGTQKTKDLFLTLPSTGEFAFVQVKSKTNSSELKSYIDQINNFPDETRMFYVYHSGEAKTDDDRVTLIGPQKLADLVVNAGLINWLISKASIEAKSTSRNA